MLQEELEMVEYPLSFSSETVAKSGTAGTWVTKSDEGSSECCVPVIFSGSGRALSPEDLFNHALTNCFIATFKVYAEKSKLNFDSVTADSHLVVEKDKNTDKVTMKSIKIDVKIFNPSDPKKARTLAEKASKDGFILNSVKTDLHFTFKTERNEI